MKNLLHRMTNLSFRAINLSFRAKSRNLCLSFLFLVILFSCTDVEETAPNTATPAPSKTLGHIVVKLEDASARTITAEKINLADCSFTLEGKMRAANTDTSDTKETSFKKTWENYEKMQKDGEIYLELGFWNFTLTLKKGDAAVYIAETTVKIVAGENPLNLKLKEASGTGSALVTLAFPAGSGIEKVKAALLNISDRTEVLGFEAESLPITLGSPNNSVTYEKAAIPAGSYILQFDFYDNIGEKISLSVLEAIQIKSGRQSKKNLEIKELETARFYRKEAAAIVKGEGFDVSRAIESEPKNIAASNFTWKVDKEDIATIDENGILSEKEGASITYPEIVTVTATPKKGGKAITCSFVFDDDLVLNRTKLQKLCTSKGIDYTKMTEFEIPHGYKKIFNSEYSGTFASLTSLETVTIPETIETIGNYSFQSCTSLKTINKDGTLPKNLKSIAIGAFNNCASLEKITIPGSLESIGTLDDYTGVFDGCGGLKELIIEEGVKTIGKYAFKLYYYSNGSYTYSKIKTITIPKSVETIGYEAFYNCKNLETVIFEEGSNCKTIGYGAFEDCDKLTNITLPRNPDIETKIESNAFYSTSGKGFQNVTSLTIPGNIKEIGDSAFSNYPNLAHLTIEEGVEKIGRDAFANGINNYPIRELVIPSTVTEIGQYAFYHFNNSCSETDPFVCVFKSETATFSSYYMFSNATNVKTFVPESAIYDYYEKVSSSYYLGVEGKNTYLLRPSDTSHWFDTNGNGVKDADEKNYYFFAVEPGETDDAAFDSALLPKPTKDGTIPSVVEWSYASDVFKYIDNPKHGGVIKTLYASIVSGISLDSIGESDIRISYDSTSKSLYVPKGYKSYKWFIDGEKQSETSRMLNISSLKNGFYRIFVLAEDMSGNKYSASYNLTWEAKQ